MKVLVLAASLAAVLPLSAAATTFTYDFNFTFAQTGDNDSVNGFRSRGTGGDLTGFFTIDDQSNIVDFGFDFEVIQPADRFQSARTDQVNLTRDTGDFFSTTIFPAGGGVPERTRFGFSEVDGSVQCTFRNAVGSRFSLSFDAFSFSPGGQTVTFDARSTRASPFCNQFGGLQFTTTQSAGQIQISDSVTGTLRAAPVPLPASGAMLGLAVLAGGAVMRRQREGA